MIIFRFIIWLFWDFSGLRFIREKIRPSEPSLKKRPPSTFLLWIFGIYVVCFIIASQRYDNRIGFIQNRTSSVLALLVKDETRKSAIRHIPKIQNMKIPLKPDILRPDITLKSIFFKLTHRDQENIDILKRAIEDFKSELSGAQLIEANLEHAELMRADLSEAILTKANLSDARLKEADLQGAILTEANLAKVDLREADLRGADLERANLEGANLLNANLKGANLKRTNIEKTILEDANLEETKSLTIEQLSKVMTLYRAELDQEIIKQIQKNYPNLLKKPEKHPVIRKIMPSY